MKRNIPFWRVRGAVQCTSSALRTTLVSFKSKGVSRAIHYTSLQNVQHVLVRNTRGLTLEFCFVLLAKNRCPMLHTKYCKITLQYVTCFKITAQNRSEISVEKLCLRKSRLSDFLTAVEMLLLEKVLHGTALACYD